MTDSTYIIDRCDYYRDYSHDTIAVLKSQSQMTNAPSIKNYYDFIVLNFIDYFTLSYCTRLVFNHNSNQYNVLNSSGDVIGDYTLKSVPSIWGLLRWQIKAM